MDQWLLHTVGKHGAYCSRCHFPHLCEPTRPQGFLEYWSATSYEAPGPAAVSFSSKLDTDLFDVAKAKAVARSIEV